MTFVAQGDILTMQLVFSSEECPEYLNAGYNDATGIFANGQAELSIGSDEISIDNITDEETAAGDGRSSPAETSMSAIRATCWPMTRRRKGQR